MMLEKEEKFIRVGPKVRTCCNSACCMVRVSFEVTNTQGVIRLLSRCDFIPVALYLQDTGLTSSCHRYKNLNKVPLPGGALVTMRL